MVNRKANRDEFKLSYRRAGKATVCKGSATRKSERMSSGNERAGENEKRRHGEAGALVATVGSVPGTSRGIG